MQTLLLVRCEMLATTMDFWSVREEMMFKQDLQREVRGVRACACGSEAVGTWKCRVRERKTSRARWLGHRKQAAGITEAVQHPSRDE